MKRYVYCILLFISVLCYYHEWCYDWAVCGSYDGGETWLDSSVGRASIQYTVDPRFDSPFSHFFCSVLLSYYLVGHMSGVRFFHPSQWVVKNYFVIPTRNCATIWKWLDWTRSNWNHERSLISTFVFFCELVSFNKLK